MSEPHKVREDSVLFYAVSLGTLVIGIINQDSQFGVYGRK